MIYLANTTYADWGPVSSGIIVGWVTDGSNYSVIHSKDNLISAGKFSHVAVNYNASATLNKKFTIYVNAVDQTNRTDVNSFGSLSSMSAGNIVIGANTIWSYENYLGTVDEVAIWNRSLSATEIRNIYNTTKKRYSANFTINNIADGSYKWNCLAFDNTSQSDWGDTNWTFTRGAASTAPTTMLRTPATGTSFTDTNITLRCNATSITTRELRNISLWTNKTGTWQRNRTIDVREIQPGDKNLVLPMHFNNDSSVGEWYDNETEILTKQGWKHFYEIPGTEKVATLNQKTGETEWQLPTAKQNL